MTDLLRPLTQEERQHAYQAAQNAVQRALGPRPTREQFSHHTGSTYPASVTRLITLLCLVLLLAAFTPSAIRLYVIGAKTFGDSLNEFQEEKPAQKPVDKPVIQAVKKNTAAQTLVGLATVLSAEAGQIVFSLALATLGAARSSRRLLYTSALIATLIALVGNIQVALPGHVTSPFAWLEAITPPLLVLSTAYVLKEQLLDTIRQRHANERAYQEAMTTWSSATSAPEIHPRWPQLHANALRDTLRKANARRKDTLESLTVADWRSLVHREQQADTWYETPGPEILSPAVEPVPLAFSPNGHHNNGHHN